MKATKRLIESKISNLKIDLEAETSIGEKAKDILCDLAPATEKVFEAAAVSISNPIAKWILILAAMIIETVREKNCPKEEKKE